MGGYKERAIDPRFKNGVVPDGVKDGVNDTFSLPSGKSYVMGTLLVMLNGQQINPNNINEIGPSYTSFQITGDTLPDSTDTFVISYLLRLA